MATPPPSFPPRLTFGSLAIYPRKPLTTQLQKDASAFIVSGVKRDAVTTRTNPPRSYIQIAIDKLVELLPGSCLDGFFDSGAVLVAAPGSALSRANSVSPTRSICKALRDAGLGSEISTCLQRVKAIRKSAYCAPGERPEAIEHYETMAVDLPLHAQPPERILLVDDVITRGATVMAAAARLRDAYPGAVIDVFALARTETIGDRFYDPCVGEITIWPNGTNVQRHDSVGLLNE